VTAREIARALADLRAEVARLREDLNVMADVAGLFYDAGWSDALGIPARDRRAKLVLVRDEPPSRS
jgi:hypothetical protein